MGSLKTWENIFGLSLNGFIHRYLMERLTLCWDTWVRPLNLRYLSRFNKFIRYLRFLFVILTLMTHYLKSVDVPLLQIIVHLYLFSRFFFFILRKWLTIKSLNGILMSSLVLKRWLNLRENFHFPHILQRLEITVHQFF